MLVSIRSRTQPDADDASSLLRDCHGRIRHFTQLAISLPLATDSPPAEVSDAARRLQRYFTVALPLHSDDEDRSVAPRLLAATPPSELRDALATIASEHVQIHAAIASLDQHWVEIIRAPDRLVELSGILSDGAEAMRALWAQHLELEEAVIFPAIDKLLAPEARAAIRDEMRTRRPTHSFLPR